MDVQKKIGEYMDISKSEGKWLMLSLLLPKIFFTPIYTLVKRSCTGAYIEVVYISIIAIILISIIVKLYAEFEGKDIYSITHFACGKTGAFLIGTLLLMLSLVNTIIMFREFASVISLLTLKGSTLFYVMSFISLTIFFSARKGIFGLSKISVLWGVLISFILLSILLMSIPEMNINNIYPVFGNGFKKILSGYEDIPIFYELIYFIFILPYIGKSHKNVGYKSVITYSFILLVFTLAYTLLVPYPTSEKFKFPLLQITSSVNLDILFQRIEALYLIAVIFSSFVYLGTTFTISLNIAKNTFCISDCKALIGAFLIIVFTSSLFFKNTESAFIAQNVFSKIFFVIGYIVVIFILTLANIKKRHMKGENK